jgi:phenylalanyl-tRNA synthetase beta chain
LAAAGLMECVTFSFMARSEAERFGDTPDALSLSNPIAADLDQLRPTPLATLALAAKRNAARGYPDVALFEIGPAFAIDAPDGQKLVASGLRSGQTPRNWLAPQRPVDVMDAKADLWALLTAVGVPLDALQVTTDAPGFLHPGRSGMVRQGPKTPLGYFGEIHPRLLAALGLPGPMVAFELNLDAVADPKRRRKSTPDLPAFQPVRRDFAFIVDSAVAADSVLRAAKGAERALITAVSLFDVYEGERMTEGKKSLGVEVTFQPRDKTLTDPEIEAACQKVIAAVAKATGATLR